MTCGMRLKTAKILARLCYWLKFLCKEAYLLILWLLTDHSGKPSASRLVVYVWTFFSIRWINHAVLATGTIPEIAVPLALISLIGPAISIALKKAPANATIGLLSDLIKSSGKQTGLYDEPYMGSIRAEPNTEES